MLDGPYNASATAKQMYAFILVPPWRIEVKAALSVLRIGLIIKMMRVILAPRERIVNAMGPVGRVERSVFVRFRIMRAGKKT